MRPVLRRRAIADPADAIETILRLAVLLSAGLPATKAWTHLAEDGNPTALSAARAAAAGGDVGAVLARVRLATPRVHQRPLKPRHTPVHPSTPLLAKSKVAAKNREVC